MNFERPSYSVNEDEIRRMGAEKGWSDTEIDAKIISEKAKIESANAKVSSEVEEDENEKALSSLMGAFEERAKRDPEFRKRLEELNEEQAA